MSEGTVPPRSLNFALLGDQMFNKNLLHRVARNRELRVRDVGGRETIGFVTGLDEEWLSLTTTEGQRLCLRQLINLTGIDETGYSLKTIQVSEEARTRIRRFTYALHMKAREICRELNDEKDVEDEEDDTSTSN